MILNGNRVIPKNFVTVHQLIEIDIDKPEARPITVGSLNFVMLTKYFLMDAIVTCTYWFMLFLRGFNWYEGSIRKVHCHTREISSQSETAKVSKYQLYMDGKACLSKPQTNYFRLIELLTSTEIFSKRRKIYAFWRKTRVHCVSVIWSSTDIFICSSIKYLICDLHFTHLSRFNSLIYHFMITNRLTVLFYYSGRPFTVLTPNKINV